MYRYTCDERQCNLSYIGYTQFLLKQRFSGHAQNGSIKHILACYPSRMVKTKELLNNFLILYKSRDKANLLIVEAMHIHQFKPKSTPRVNFVMVRYICLRISIIEFLIVEPYQATLVLDHVYVISKIFSNFQEKASKIYFYFCI